MAGRHDVFEGVVAVSEGAIWRRNSLSSSQLRRENRKKDLCLLANTLSVKLTSLLHEAYTAEHLIMMGMIGTVRDEVEEKYDDNFCTEIRHITDEVNAALKTVDIWKHNGLKKDLKAVLKKNFILGVPHLWYIYILVCYAVVGLHDCMILWLTIIVCIICIINIYIHI